MSERVRMVCAGALLLVALGCVPRSFQAPTSAPRYRRAIAAPVAEVAAVLETGLGEAGVSVLTKRRPGEVRLAGATKAGNIFCLHVRRLTGQGGVRTLVSVVWDRDPDEAFWQTVLDILKEAEAAADEPAAEPPG